MSELLQDLIMECIQTVRSIGLNDDFALFFVDTCDWTAEICNPVSAVMLGESRGDFSARGKTPCEAVQNLLKELRSETSS